MALAYPTFVSAIGKRKLGDICIAWAQVEFLMDVAANWAFNVEFGQPTEISSFPEIPRRAKEFSDRIAGLPKCTAHADRLRAILDEIRSIAPRRNLAVHGNWGFNVDANEPGALSWFHVLAGDPAKTILESELQGIVDRIEDISVRFKAFLEDVGVLPTA